MINKKIVGKAYAFLDHEKEGSEIIAYLEENRAKANFPDNLEFIILRDKLNKSVSERKEKLPTKIEQVSRGTKVYGAFPSNMRISPGVLQPKRACSLRYIIMAKAPEVTDSEYAEPLGQARANMVTAEMLNCVINFICNSECSAGKIKYLRSVVLYKDGRDRVQRYI